MENDEGIRVEFTPAEMKAMVQLSCRVRQAKGVGADAVNEKGLRFEETNLKGFKGAAAAARVLGVEWDDGVYPGRDPGWDLVYRGLTLDAKLLQWWLVFDSPEHFRADVAVLVHPTEHADVVVVRGWIERERFLQEAFTANLGYGNRLCVAKERLSPMWALEGYAASLRRGETWERRESR